MSTQESVPMHCWLVEPLSKDVKQALQRLQCSDDVQHIAVMPDIHLAHDICIGTVVATEHLLYPDAVGGDIGCGMSVIQMHAEADFLKDERAAARLLHGLYRVVPTNKHGANAPESLPEELQQQSLPSLRLEKMKHREGRVQLGTLGRGNHFLELQADTEGMLWVMVHSGSRAMGQAIRHHTLQHATASQTGLMFVDSREESGQNYLDAMQWALRYATLNRQAMLEAVIQLLGDLFDISVQEGSWLDCHHNYVCREEHNGRMLWVHRKGANAAYMGQPGIIPGSMGSSSYVVEGRGEPSALCSSSHGAGRSQSRTQARREITPRALRQQMRGIWFDQRLETLLVEEAPSAYKDIRVVMRAQRDLVRIVETLQPILAYKGR